MYKTKYINQKYLNSVKYLTGKLNVPSSILKQTFQI